MRFCPWGQRGAPIDARRARIFALLAGPIANAQAPATGSVSGRVLNVARGRYSPTSARYATGYRHEEFGVQIAVGVNGTF